MYHKIINKQGELIGVSANDEENILDENWIEITPKEYEELIASINQNVDNED